MGVHIKGLDMPKDCKGIELVFIPIDGDIIYNSESMSIGADQIVEIPDDIITIIQNAKDMVKLLNSDGTDEWCTDCKEYDHERHCCPRFNRVIRTAILEAETEDERLSV